MCRPLGCSTKAKASLGLPNESLIQKGFQSHAQSGVVFIVQGNETEGLQAARGQLACWRQKLGPTANDTVACPKCHFHNDTLLKSFRQDQQSASGREYVQQASNGLTAFRTNCNANRATNPYAPCPLVWIGLMKIGHYWRICHPSPELPRLPKGVADRLTALGYCRCIL